MHSTKNTRCHHMEDGLKLETYPLIDNPLKPTKTLVIYVGVFRKWLIRHYLIYMMEVCLKV